MIRRARLCVRRIGGCLVMLAAMIAMPAFAAAPYKYRTLDSFGVALSGSPAAPLVVGPDGLAYGSLSGDFSQTDPGMIFRIERDNSITVIHAFAADGSEGLWPTGPGAFGPDGSLYGIASGGGAGHRGVIYRLSPSGTLDVLHAFSYTDDAYIGPVGGLLAGPDGNFYGELSTWGMTAQIHSGAIYRISPAGTVTVLHVFDPSAELGLGGTPTFGVDERLYGTTEWTGITTDPCPASGCGTLWAMAMDGTFEFLHLFSGGADGENPMGNLLTTSDGEIYGTVFRGAASGGAVYRLNRKGKFETAYDFDSDDPVTGSNPMAGLAEGTNGVLVGSTVFGGEYQHGVLFTLSRKGAVKVLHSFGSSTDDGQLVVSPVTPMPNGGILGLTLQGGDAGEGTMFQLKPRK